MCLEFLQKFSLGGEIVSYNNKVCEKAEIMDSCAMDRALSRMTYQIIERNHGVDNIVLVGIYSRGCELSQRIKQRIKLLEEKDVPSGFLDITKYRDDQKPPEDYKEKTNINFDYKNKTVILIDDVMYTGRSVRAAIEGIMRKERPKSVQLAVLIDRGHREVPIRPDYVGKNLPTAKNETVKVEVKEIDGKDRVSILNIA